MAEHPLKKGDKVTHPRNPDRLGTVVEVEEDRYSYTDPIYHVAWSEDGPAIPYRNYHNLQKVPSVAPPIGEPWRGLVVVNANTHERAEVIREYGEWIELVILPDRKRYTALRGAWSPER